MNRLMLHSLALATIVLCGCVDTEIAINVRADGSGTVTQRIAVKGQMAAMMKQAGPASETIDREAVARSARDMGNGVTVQSIEALPEAQGPGALAVFAFADVTQLGVSQNPLAGMTPDAGNEPADEPRIRFQFEPGSTPTLRVHLPQQSLTDGQRDDARDDEPDEPSSQMDDAMVAAFKQFMGGLRVAMVIAVEGTVVETNASYVDGNRVTLVELDFDALMQADPDAAGSLQPGTSTDDIKAALRDVPGVKLEIEQGLVIRFTPGGDTTTAAVMKPLSASGDNQVRADGRPAWQQVAPGALEGYRTTLVSVVTADGTVHKGLLEALTSEAIVLRRARSDGGGTISVPRSSVERTEALLRGP